MELNRLTIVLPNIDRQFVYGALVSHQNPVISQTPEETRFRALFEKAKQALQNPSRLFSTLHDLFAELKEAGSHIKAEIILNDGSRDYRLFLETDQSDRRLTLGMEFLFKGARLPLSWKSRLSILSTKDY